MSKKILQINIVCETGSTGRIVKYIDNLMKDEHLESYIAYGYGKTNMPNAIKIGTKLDYYIHNILSRLFCAQGRFSYFATKRFLKKVDKIKPDIIHLHNIHGNYINYKSLFKYIKQKNIPVIWTLHDCWAFTGKCTHYQRINCDKWQTNCKNCKECKKNLKEYPKSYLICNSKNEYINKKKSFTGVKNLTIITPSQWLKDEVKKSFLKNYNVKVINNGIDLTDFKPIKSDYREKLGIDYNDIIILGVANDWSYKKGLDTFIQLSNILDDKYKIVLLGLDDNQIKKLPNKIIKISRTQNIEELAKLYSIADIYINPTLEDNFPTTNLEALACGTPVITYNTGGSPESISGNCGKVVEKDNILDLVNSIEKFNFDDNLSKNCIERAKNYDKSQKFKEYIDLYFNILNKR